jgi:hypothetical protein
MEKRAIRITIELPEDLATSPEVAMSTTGAAGVIAPVGSIEPTSGQGPSLTSGEGGGSEPAGGPIDAGAAPPHLVAALGGDAALSGREIGTEGDGTGSGLVGGVEGSAGSDRAIDAGPLPDYVANLLEASGPRHPMADSPDFRAALAAEDTFHRN